MSETMYDFLPEDRQIFRRVETLAEALGQIARKIAPIGTAKAIARRWNIESPTAENVAKERAASATTLVKALRAESDDAWALWDAVGELLIGESREAYDERKLSRLIEKTNEARERLEARRARRLELEEAVSFAPVDRR